MKVTKSKRGYTAKYLLEQSRLYSLRKAFIDAEANIYDEDSLAILYSMYHELIRVLTEKSR